MGHSSSRSQTFTKRTLSHARMSWVPLYPTSESHFGLCWSCRSVTMAQRTGAFVKGEKYALSESEESAQGCVCMTRWTWWKVVYRASIDGILSTINLPLTRLAMTLCFEV